MTWILEMKVEIIINLTLEINLAVDTSGIAYQHKGNMNNSGIKDAKGFENSNEKVVFGGNA